MACTVTTGGAISGYCAIGRLLIAARPASTMKIERTAAKIGRSMKKRESMLFLRRWLGGGLAARLRRRLSACFRNAHRRAGPETHQAIGDDAVARLHALGHHPGVPRPVADFD